MLEWLKSTWARWKVQVSFVGGVLVIATAYGTCSYEPQVVSDAGVNSSTVEATSEHVSVEVSEEIPVTTVEVSEEIPVTTEETTNTNATNE